MLESKINGTRETFIWYRVNLDLKFSINRKVCNKILPGINILRRERIETISEDRCYNGL